MDKVKECGGMEEAEVGISLVRDNSDGSNGGAALAWRMVPGSIPGISS